MLDRGHGRPLLVTGGCMPIDFRPSEGRTLGIEVEFGVVDRATLGLVSAASTLLGEIGSQYPSGQHPKAKHELFECTVEIITGICDTVGDAVQDLTETWQQLATAADAHHWALYCAGSHPFSLGRDQDVSPEARYFELVESLPQAHEFLIFGIHYHVGITRPERVIALLNAALMYLPHLLALSASSPITERTDHGMVSHRTKIFESLPRAGVPPQFRDWQHFENVYDVWHNAGKIESIRDIWWDIRPHPDFGTIELRICDGLTSLSRVGAIGAIVTSLFAMFEEQLDGNQVLPAIDRVFIEENKMQAATHGLDAVIIEPKQGILDARPLRSSLEDLLTALEPYAVSLQCATELQDAAKLAERPSYVEQREILKSGGSPEDIVHMLVSQMEESQHERSIGA